MGSINLSFLSDRRVIMFPNSMTATIAITDSRKTRTLTAPETANKPIFIAGSSGQQCIKYPAQAGNNELHQDQEKPMKTVSRSTLGLIALFAILLSACTTADVRTPEQTRAMLAPSGKLRVGMYAGSPSSIVEGATPADAKGVGFDLGKALAARLGVPFEAVVFPSNAGVLAAMASATIDVTFTNASPERAQHMDFSQTYMNVEKSFLVPQGSPITSLSAMQRPGIRIGFSSGSSTAEELSPQYPQAVMIAAPTLARAGEMLAAGKIDAFATNKAILFQLGDGLPGSQVLAGHWGMEHFAAAIPKGREQALPFMRNFIDEARSDGLVTQAISRAGLRGTVPAAAAGSSQE